ncbi:hypothetical protein NKDENANG_00549 [Candidatus Entotheonellaceae bacterium PAL068K]
MLYAPSDNRTGCQGDLTVLADDARARVRQAAAFALGLQGDTRAVAPLLQAMTDAEVGVREGAAAALAGSEPGGLSPCWRRP